MQLTELFEAKYSGANVGSAMSKIVSYLERAMSFKLLKLGVETFHNSAENARGIRYVELGTLNCIRFNWVGSKSSEIVSIDLWNGSSRDPNFHIKLNGTSLVKALPALVQVLKSPKIGKVSVTEALVLEVKKGEFSETSAVNDMIQKLEAGRSFNRSEFINAYHVDNAHAFDEFVEANKDDLVFTGKRISIPKGTKLGAKSDGGGGGLTVTKGGSGEEYEVEVPESEDRVTFSDSIKDLEGLTTAVIRGNANALFVAGRGGTGKTQTVEDVLAAAGLEDGKGYEKITGSASPIGIYYALYKNRTGIILFDDCDGALDQQDGRNVIKAATDTKKIRKIAWGKKNPGMYDPDSRAPPPSDPDEDEGVDDEEGGDDDGGSSGKQDDKIPNRFNFEGRVIFISNMPLNKLDPDGALRTRAFVISVDPTPEEMFERMGEILHSIRLESGSLSDKERQEVLTVVRGSKRAKDASLRTLVRALNLASSGAPNWKLLVQRYA
jgi:hypothetical protein